MRMKSLLMVCGVLLLLGSVSYAQAERPFLGVFLDAESSPLPRLLTKHLGLDPEQGLRIINVGAGTPADAAGLEPDDIIATFQGRKITGSEELVQAVQEAGVGAEVSLEVIHLGQRKTVQLTLEPVRMVEWKYPPQPEAITSLRPGKVFKIDPAGEKWLEIPIEKLHEFDVDVQKFFNEIYTYEYDVDGRDITITVKGDPADDDSKVIVEADGAEYTMTPREIDTMPEKYQKPARDALENARKSVEKDTRVRSRLRLPDPPRPETFRRYFSTPRPDMGYWSERGERAVEKLQEQMERLQQRMKQMEERHREMLDNLLSSKDRIRPESKVQRQPASPQPREDTL